MLLLVAGCDKQAALIRKAKSDPAAKNEVYSLILEARKFMVMTELDNDPYRLTGIREQIVRVSAYTKASPTFTAMGLPQLFDGVISNSDARIEYVQSIPRIAALMRERAEQDEKTAAMNGTVTGIKAGTPENSDEDFQYGKAIVHGLIEAYQESKELEMARTAEEREQIERAQTKYLDARMASLSTCEFAAAAVAKNLGVPGTSTGFDTLDEDIKFQQANTEASAVTLAEYRRWLQKRPDDRRLKTIVSWQASVVEPQTTQSLLDAAQSCAALVDGMPAASVFDADRAFSLSFAAQILEGRLDTDYPVWSSWCNVKSSEAGVAADYRIRSLAYASADVYGDANERLAWDEFLAGNLKEALNYLVVSHQKPNFQASAQDSFKLAQLYCGLNDTDDALKWVRDLVVNRGFNDVKWLNDDKDLALMRQEQSAGFQDLVKVNCSFWVRYGVFNDDIVLENHSNMALTHVTFDVSLYQGDRSWVRHLTVSRIEPGDSYSWVNEVSIPDSRLDRKEGNVTCDQNNF